ncbi:MAG: hypothetical protein ACRDMJ_01515 [Solirubrobacteraceae bacterium]
MSTDSSPAPDPEPREAFGRFRRRFDRIRALPDLGAESSSPDDEAELEIKVMLLHEENARLKSARHRPSDFGSAIDRARVLSLADAQAEAEAEADADAERLDDAWAVLSECMAIREGLDQVCAELQGAIETVRERLSTLAADG